MRNYEHECRDFCEICVSEFFVDNLCICYKCHSYICNKCTISYDNNIYCIKCFQNCK